MVQTSSRSSKARETRKRIADTALDLFTSQGYAQTTIDEIADAAGVNRRTVFRHFPKSPALKTFDQPWPFLYTRAQGVTEETKPRASDL